MVVDLKRLERYGRSIVHCSTKDQAEMFMKAMWEQYPGLVKGIWREGQTNWGNQHMSEGGICYLPRIVRDRDEVGYCQSTRLSLHKNDGYVVVEFSELLREFDLGEFSVDGFDIKSLFGIG